MIQVVLEVVLNIVGIGQQDVESKLAGIVEMLFGRRLKETFLYGDPLGIEILVHLDDGVLGRSQRVFKTLDDTHRQNHTSVFMRFV